MDGKRQEAENLLRTILDNVDNNIKCKLINNMDDYISSHHHCKSNSITMEEQLDFLLFNLHHLSKYHAEKMMFPVVIQYEILQNVCGNVKDFHGLIVNGCIKHEMVENVLPQFQLMAARVGNFLWEDQIDEDSRRFKLRHLLLEIVSIELEIMHICYTNLKASTRAEVRRFIKQLLETSPDILRERLIHLQEHMVNARFQGEKSSFIGANISK